MKKSENRASQPAQRSPTAGAMAGSRQRHIGQSYSTDISMPQNSGCTGEAGKFFRQKHTSDDKFEAKLREAAEDRGEIAVELNHRGFPLWIG